MLIKIVKKTYQIPKVFPIIYALELGTPLALVTLDFSLAKMNILPFIRKNIKIIFTTLTNRSESRKLTQP